jgi:hypothetical protein
MAGENYMMIRYIDSLFVNYHYGGQIKARVMGMAGRMHGTMINT